MNPKNLNIDEFRQGMRVDEVIKAAKEYGVKRLKVGDVEVELYQAETPPAGDVDPRSLINPVLRKETEEDVMFWAVGGAGAQDAGGRDLNVPLVGEDPVDGP